MTRRCAVLVAALACVVCGGWSVAGSGHRVTFALLSDTVAVTADTGAGSLSLARSLPPGEVQAPVAVVGPDVHAEVSVTISTSEETSWVLTARVLPVGDPDADCGPLAGSSLSVEVSGAAPRTVAACGSEAQVARGAGVAVSSVVVRWSETSDVAVWEGRVQLTVTQEGGGFSDRLDIPVEVLPPALLPLADGGQAVVPPASLPPVAVAEDEDSSTQEPEEPAAEDATTSSPPATTVTPPAPTVEPPAATTPVTDEARPSDAPLSDAPDSTQSEGAIPPPDS